MGEEGNCNGWAPTTRPERGIVMQPSTVTRPIHPATLLALTAVIVSSTWISSPEQARAALGRAQSWGSNDSGQLGDGTDVDPQLSPGPVVNLNGLKAIDGGCSHSLALKGDGTVRAWGTGYLGNGPSSSSNAPVKVMDLDNVKGISAGCGHSLAVKENGTARAWGVNDCGQLGDGTSQSRNKPVKVDGLDNVKAVSAGFHMSAFLLKNGKVKTIGCNDSGQLGNGNDEDKDTLQTVLNLSGVKAITNSDDNFHMLAIKENGTLRAWGDNLYGQLGHNSSDEASFVPVTVQGVTDAKDIAAGAYHSVAVTEDGSVWVWGNNADGQLGQGTADVGSRFPLLIESISNARAVAAGSYFSLALKRNGTAQAWGDNDEGQLGDGTQDEDRLEPVSVGGLSDAFAIGAGSEHSLALKT